MLKGVCKRSRAVGNTDQNKTPNLPPKSNSQLYRSVDPHSCMPVFAEESNMTEISYLQELLQEADRIDQSFVHSRKLLLQGESVLTNLTCSLIFYISLDDADKPPLSMILW